MKTTIVPAQITTVEDKIAGNLSFTQLLLLMGPVILTGLCFVLLPPLVRVTAPKLVVGGFLLMAGALLATRLGGELILQRIITRISYNLRPQYYVLDKNDHYLRAAPSGLLAAATAIVEPAAVAVVSTQLIDKPERSRLENAIDDPRSRFRLMVKKGGLHVSIHEIKD